MKLISAALVSMLASGAQAGLVPSEEEHFRYDQQSFLTTVCKRLMREPAVDLPQPLAMGENLCADDLEYRNQNLQLQFEQHITVPVNGELKKVELLYVDMPFVRKLQRDYYIRYDDQYLWLFQQRRNIQRNEILEFNEFAWLPKEQHLRIEVLSQVYFPPDPNRKYEYTNKVYELDFSDPAKPVYHLYNFPSVMWHASMAEDTIRQPSYLVFDPITDELVHLGEKALGHQIAWLNDWPAEAAARDAQPGDEQAAE